MNAALWRKLRADIQSNRLQFLLIFGVLALSAMLLTVSLLVMGSANQPWDHTFEATNGPHLWVVSQEYDLDFSPLTQDPAVTESSGTLLSLADNPLVIGDEKVAMFLYAMDTPPAVANPLVAAGRWLESANPDEVVLDFSLAKFYDLQVGDAVSFIGAAGQRELAVVGLAVTAHWFPYDEITKDSSPGVGYISQATLETLQPDPAAWFSVIGVRLLDPENSKAMVDQTYDMFPGKLRSVLDWQYIKDNASLANTLNAMFMGLFSILGLAAVGMIIFNTIGGQVLSQYREIGLLKAIGVAPGQVTALFLTEHLSVGLGASIVGILLGLLAAPGLIERMARNLNAPMPELYQPAPLVGVLVVVEVAIALATLLPAWQGGRIDTVQAITTGYRSQRARRSRLGQLATWLRLPPVFVLGVKDTFSRPLRATLAIASLLLTIMVAVTAVGAQTTTQKLANNKFYFNGTTADMKVVRNFVPHEMIVQEIDANADIVGGYQELFLYGQAPGHGDQPLALRFLEGSYLDFDFQIKEGRMIAGPGEAVAGYPVFGLLGARIGDTVEIQVEGKPLRVTLVGRNTESLFLNYVIITSLETYQQQIEASAKPSTYYLQLKDAGQAGALRRAWLDRSQGALTIAVTTQEPVASVVQLTALITSMALILMIVAAANLMSASLLGIRERVRDFGIQKTLGLTPAQIAGSVVVGTVSIAVVALLFGITLGTLVMDRFIQQVGIMIGAGPDFYQIDWVAISLLIPILVVVAILSSLLPAMRAAQFEVTDALRYE